VEECKIEYHGDNDGPDLPPAFIEDDAIDVLKNKINQKPAAAVVTSDREGEDIESEGRPPLPPMVRRSPYRVSSVESQDDYESITSMTGDDNETIQHSTDVPILEATLVDDSNDPVYDATLVWEPVTHNNNAAKDGVRKTKILQRVLGMAMLLIIALAAIIGSLDSTVIFRTCFGIILGIFGCIQLYIAATLYQNRSNVLLELYQPVLLALFAICGAIATFASFMFTLPEFDISCALRQPIIFTCLSFMGNILLVRTWRIGCIMGASRSFREEDNNARVGKMETSITVSRLAIMKLLSRISSWRGFISSCGKKKSISNIGIRSKITFADSMWVVAVLMIPQIILQIINLSIPSVRLESVEVYEEVYICESDLDSWSLAVGIVLVVIPFFVSLLLNTKGDGAVPDQFRELSEITSSLFASCCILIITLPTATMIKDTVEAYAYLMGASVLSLTLPLCFRIAKSFSKSSLSIDESSEYSSGRLKAAESSSIMGDLFEKMEKPDKALEIDKCILTLFKSDGEYTWEDGFNSSEIRSLGPKELEVVVSTMIDSAKRWWKVFQSKPSDNEGEEAKSRAFRTCMGSLSIFKEAPAKKLMKDRSVIFPGYSFMVAMTKMVQTYNPPDGQSPEDFENEVALSFVEETSFQQYHHGRSLAMKADMMRKHGRYEDALSALDKMKLIYEPRLHSKVILQEYVSDHCAELLAASVSWLCYLGRKEEALRLCDYIIEKILPEIGEQEFLSLSLILYPICLCFKDQGTDKAAHALELYEKHIIQPMAEGGKKTHPVAIHMATPMMIILNCLNSDGEAYASAKDDIVYMLNEEDEKYPSYMDPVAISYYDVAFSTIYAEVCLCLSNMNVCGEQDSVALRKEGYRYLGISEATLKREDGSVTSAVAYSYTLVYCRVLRKQR